MEDGILIVVALGWERAAITRGIDALPFARNGSASIFRGTERHRGLWILQTGLGTERAGAALRWAANAVRPAVALSTGCAGALREGPRSGDVILGAEIIGARGNASATSVTWRERYRAAAVDAGLRVWQNRILTMSGIVSRAEEKRRIGEEAKALAVEMEGIAIADWCRAAGVEFAAARVILDPVETSIPAEISAITTGCPSGGSLLRAIARRPALIPELIRLAAATVKCRRALGGLHRELIRGLWQEGLLPK